MGYLPFVALLLTIYAVIANCTTLASGDYIGAVSLAIVFAGIAILLSCAAWRQLPQAGRAITVFVVLVNAWVLLDAGGRRLPAILGW